MKKRGELVMDLLLDRLERKERTIMRLTRKLGKANWRLKQAVKPKVVPKAGWAPGTAPDGCAEAKPADTCVADARKERDDALDRHKQAHDQAMALHVVIDQAVHELREAAGRMDIGPAEDQIKEAIGLLTRGWGLAGEAKSEVEVLRANAANWEAEALERAQNQTDLENRMDAAAKLLGGALALPSIGQWPKVKQALAILMRDEEPEA